MKIELLSGSYELQTGFDALSQTIHNKIRQFEERISHDLPEEDIEWVERKITQLTADWHIIKQTLRNHRP